MTDVDEQTAMAMASYFDDGLEDEWTCPECGYLIDTPNHEFGCHAELEEERE